ncbi:tetratricopeptide repeat protein [Francisella philomiragia]|uniref:tetratricopeptide repeat protein n=1 Tax=Francisella philomiragia TaxID=28110 RepID=UPI003510E1EC
MRRLFCICLITIFCIDFSYCADTISHQDNDFRKCLSLYSNKEYKKILEECNNFPPNTKEYGVSNMMIGFMYEHGLYVKKDYKKAAEYLTIAADKNFPEAQYDLAILYIRGLGVDKDEFKAIQLFKASAWAEKSTPTIKSATWLKMIKQKIESGQKGAIGEKRFIISISKGECEKIGGEYNDFNGISCFSKKTGNYINTLQYALDYKDE